METLRSSLVALGLLSLAAGMAGACSAADPVFEEDDDGSTTTTTTVASTGTGVTTGGGSTGQGGMGGGGGSDLGPCGQDCSLIDTPPCLKSVCNTGNFPGAIGSCVVVPEDQGVSCDDGQFCTVDDSCDGSGTCVGGPQNDCGMAAPECNEIVCDEQAKSCSNQALADGTMCTSTDLCLTGTTCTAGTCGGGTTKDCFFSPVPNECFISQCNPTNGMCEPIPGNDGQTCVDQMDLCSVGNTCSNGVCAGGTPKDCSALTQGCNLGVCDAMNGNCTTMAVMNGNACDDLDACTTGEICTMGMCGGGSPVTTCTGMTADGCCPSGCQGVDAMQAAYDIDCACGLDKLRIVENNVGTPDFIIFENPTTCALQLDPLEIFYDDSSLTDVTYQVPAFTLPAMSTVIISESTAPPNGLSTGTNVFFSGTRGGAVYLCDGPCTNAANVIDVLAWEGGAAAPPLLPGISFTPSAVTGVTSANESTTSHVRAATAGTAPNFLQSDWTTGPETVF